MLRNGDVGRAGSFELCSCFLPFIEDFFEKKLGCKKVKKSPNQKLLIE